MSSLSRKLLTGFSLLGLGASSAATYVHYNLIRTPDYSSFCDINATVSCKAAYLSRYGSIAGVPYSHVVVTSLHAAPEIRQKLASLDVAPERVFCL